MKCVKSIIFFALIFCCNVFVVFAQDEQRSFFAKDLAGAYTTGHLKQLLEFYNNASAQRFLLQLQDEIDKAVANE